MNDITEDGSHRDADTPAPLPGEPGIPDVAGPSRPPMSRKALLAVALLVLSLVGVSALSIQRFATSGKKSDEASRRASDRPAAATGDPKRLDMSAAPVATPASAAPPGIRIPAIVPTDEEAVEPIGVRRTGQGAPATNGGTQPIAPEDQPSVLVTSRPNASRGPSADFVQTAGNAEPTPPQDGPLAQTRRNLEGYERQLQAVLDSQRKSPPAPGMTSPGGSSIAPTPPGGPTYGGTTPSQTAPAGGLFGGQLQGSATPRVAATLLGNRSLVLPKGTAFTCALKTKVVSATSGFVGCQVQRDVFSDDGRVLLIERGSHMDGEYRVASVKPGTVRIPVLWTRIRTPNGVTVDIDSPGTGPLGESGIDGYVDNRWLERIGAALLLSLIDDSVKLLLQHEMSTSQSNTLVLPSTTENTSKLAEKVLDSTINIPPLIYQNQGGIVGIYVARDVDFSSVYELKPVPR